MTNRAGSHFCASATPEQARTAKIQIPLAILFFVLRPKKSRQKFPQKLRGDRVATHNAVLKHVAEILEEENIKSIIEQ